MAKSCLLVALAVAGAALAAPSQRELSQEPRAGLLHKWWCAKHLDDHRCAKAPEPNRIGSPNWGRIQLSNVDPAQLSNVGQLSNALDHPEIQLTRDQIDDVPQIDAQGVPDDDVLTIDNVPTLNDGDAPTCRVLSLEGGGAFGAYEAGVLSSLAASEDFKDYDVIQGISAGALNSAYVATFQDFAEGVSALSDIWKGLKNDAVFQLCKVAGLLRLAPCVLREPPSLVDASPAHQLFKEKLTGRSVQRYFIIGATNLATGAGDLYHFPPSKALVNDAFMDRVDASYAIPTIFQPVKVDDVPHVDGGATTAILIKPGVDLCDKLYPGQNPKIHVDAILVGRKVEEISVEDADDLKIIELYSRNHEISASSQRLHQLKEFTCETKTRTSISIYEPASPLPGSMMNFNTGETLWEIGNTPSKTKRTDTYLCGMDTQGHLPGNGMGTQGHLPGNGMGGRA